MTVFEERGGKRAVEDADVQETLSPHEMWIEYEILVYFTDTITIHPAHPYQPADRIYHPSDRSVIQGVQTDDSCSDG